MSLWESTKGTVKKGTRIVTGSLLGLMGGTTSTGLVFYCAFKGAVLCSGLGTLIPGLGNIAGFVVGAILGAGFAGALLLLVYKGLIVLDKKAGDGESNFELNQDPNQDRKLIRRIDALIKHHKSNKFTGLIRVNSTLNPSEENKLTLPKLKLAFKEKTISILRQFILAKKNLDIKIEQLKTHFANLNNNLEKHFEKLLLPTFTNSTQENINIDDEDDRENPPASAPVNLVPTNKSLSLWEKIKQPFKSVWLFLRDYKNFFKYAGGAAAIGTVVSCAYYGAMIGGTVGTAIPIIGNIGGFIVGGILGAVTAGVLVFMVGKGVVTVDNVITDKKKNTQKNDLIAQLKKMKTEIANTKEQFMQLKIAAAEQINILNRTEQKRLLLRPPSLNTDSSPVQSARQNVEAIAQNFQTTSSLENSDIDTKDPLLSIHRSCDDAKLKNSFARSINNAANAGFFMPFYNFYQSIKKPTIIIAGVPAAIVTILSCSYYGALMGATLGTAVPGLGNLAGLIIGAILGAAVAGALIYVAAKGLITLDKNICGEDKHTKLINELKETEQELVLLKNQVNELNKSVDAKKQNYIIPARKNSDYQLSKATDNNELAMERAADNSNKSAAEVLKPLLTTNEKNDNKGFFTGLKDIIVNTFNNIKSPILKFLGGTAGAITIGTCGYYGAMIGLSAGSIFPGPGNIIGGVAGGIIGGLIGLCFVTITAKLGSAVYEKLTHAKSDTIKHKITSIENEVTNIEENKKQLNNNLDEIRKIWEDTYNITSDDIMSDRLTSGDLSDKSNTKAARRSKNSTSSASGPQIVKPITPASGSQIANNIGQTLLPPPSVKPVPKYLPPFSNVQKPPPSVLPGNH